MGSTVTADVSADGVPEDLHLHDEVWLHDAVAAIVVPKEAGGPLTGGIELVQTGRAEFLRAAHEVRLISRHGRCPCCTLWRRLVYGQIVLARWAKVLSCPGDAYGYMPRPRPALCDSCSAAMHVVRGALLRGDG